MVQKGIELTVTIILNDEQIKEAFENVEIRFSKAKAKRLVEIADECQPDVSEALEERLMECIQEFIYDEWGE